MINNTLSSVEVTDGIYNCFEHRKNKNPYLYIRNISNLKTPFGKANL
jgi:hypothetical protein